MALPAEVTFLTVSGKLTKAVADGADADLFPDGMPLAGQLTFTPEIGPRGYSSELKGGGRVTVASATPPVIMVVDPVPVALAGDGSFSVQLVDPKNPLLSPADWSWTVSFALTGAKTSPFSFNSPPASQVVDLASVVPVTISTGGVTFINEAAASAASAAASAVSAAAAAVSAANTVGLPGPAGPAGAAGSNVLPTDTAIANAAATPGTATNTFLSAAFDESIQATTEYVGSPNFRGGLTIRDERPEAAAMPAVVLKEAGDASPGAWDLTMAHNYGYGLHLQTLAPGAAPGMIMGLGLDNAAPDGSLGIGGILIANKHRAQGIILHQQKTLVGGDAHGIYGFQESPEAPMVSLKQAVPGAASLLDLTVLTNDATPTQRLARFYTYGTHLAGDISAFDGTLRWIDPVDVRTARVNTSITLNNALGAGVPSRMVATDPALNSGFVEVGLRANDRLRGEVAFFSSTGAGQFWAKRVHSTDQELQLQAAAPAVKGSEVYNTLLRVVSGGIGFFGAAPVARPAHPTDITSVIAALTALGLTA